MYLAMPDPMLKYRIKYGIWSCSWSTNISWFMPMKLADTSLSKKEGLFICL